MWKLRSGMPEASEAYGICFAMSSRLTAPINKEDDSNIDKLIRKGIHENTTCLSVAPVSVNRGKLQCCYNSVGGTHQGRNVSFIDHSSQSMYSARSCSVVQQEISLPASEMLVSGATLESAPQTHGSEVIQESISLCNL